MNNAVYIKAMEKLRDRTDVELVNNEKEYLSRTSKPGYMSHKIFGNNLVPMRNTKLALKLTKPVYIGMFILDLSKILMWEFHYYTKNNYDKTIIHRHW